MLSKSLPPALTRSLRSSPVLEGDKYVPKREERRLVSTAISKNITGVVRRTPHSQVAPALPKATPAIPSSAQPSANKVRNPSMVHCSSMLKTAPTLSSPLPCIRPRPSGSSPLPKGDKTKFKTEERWLVDTAISKITTSIFKHLPSLQAVPALAKAKCVGVTQAARSILCGNKSEPAGFKQVIASVPQGTRPMAAVSSGNRPEFAHSPQALTLTCRGVKTFEPADVKGEHTETAQEQSHAHRPGVAFSQCCLCPSSTSKEADTAKRHVSISVVSKNTSSKGQHSPGAKTALMLSKPLPARLMRAVSCPTPTRIGPRQQVNNVVKKESRTDLPASRNAVNRQSPLPKAGERSRECSKPTPGLVGRAQESESPGKVPVEGITSDIFSSCSNSPNVPQNASLPVVVPLLPQTSEPVAPSWAQLFHPLHLLDAPCKVYTSNTQRPQIGLETAILQPPEPRLLDTVAVLVQARLATCSVCDEFVPQAPKGPPDKSGVVEERHAYDVINGFNITAARGSPSPEAVRSLPESLPAALSQVSIPCPGFNGHKPVFGKGEKQMAIAIINKADSMSMGLHSPLVKAVLSLLCPTSAVPSQALAPCPGFNGHKPYSSPDEGNQRLAPVNKLNNGDIATCLPYSRPGLPATPLRVFIPRSGPNKHKSSSFIEGEERLVDSAINKINTTSAMHSPEPKMAFVLFIPKPVVTLRAPVPCPSLCPPREPPYTIGATLGTTVVSARGGKKEGLYAPEPLGTLNIHLSGSMLDEWLLWKPPDAKEMRQHASHVITLVISETSAAHSPKPITALSPFAFKPAAVQQALTPWLRDTAAITGPLHHSQSSMMHGGSSASTFEMGNWAGSPLEATCREGEK
jgi:hypothetical protein